MLSQTKLLSQGLSQTGLPGSSQFLLGPQQLALLPAINIENLACNMATPGLARQEENTPCDCHGRNGLGKCGADDGILVLEVMRGAGGGRTLLEHLASIDRGSAGIRI